MSTNPNEPQKKQPDPFTRYTSMAVKMIAVILVFTFGGFKLDEYIPLDFPVATLILSLAGVSLAIYVAVRDLLK